MRTLSSSISDTNTSVTCFLFSPFSCFKSLCALALIPRWHIRLHEVIHNIIFFHLFSIPDHFTYDRFSPSIFLYYIIIYLFVYYRTLEKFESNLKHFTLIIFCSEVLKYFANVDAIWQQIRKLYIIREVMNLTKSQEERKPQHNYIITTY